ncbi:hypothetical protein QTP88_000986 [Uroleucon formosanum]
MSKPKGGWEKLKETQKKKKNKADFLKKVNPLTSYFIPKYTNSENTINKEDNIINTSTSDSHNVPSLSNSLTGASSKNNDVIEYSNDPGDWNLTSHNLISYLIEKGPKFFQNINADFSLTKKYYENPKVNRCLNQTAFFYTKPNGDCCNREWLLYSPTKKMVYCYYCILFSKNNIMCDGYDDWRNVQKFLENHAKKGYHVLAISMYLNRTKLSGRIDSELEKQLTETRDYWKNVLRRIIETILFLSGRGLPFRGSDEHFGSNHNGNYLEILELLSKFDPFLAQHIAVHGNQGKGHTSYLSKTICNEFIALIANKTRTMIIDQLKKAENGINIENCRGQSYDNASNMSGTYTGMQAEIKKCNSFIDYIPCIAHSLNLVGQSAVDCCVEAVSFFGFVQEVYNFFSASTQRWDILKKTLVKNCPVPKSKSVTRWSANAEAVKALKIVLQNIRNQYDEYESNGMKRAKNEDYKLTRHRKKFKRNESGFNELNAKESFKINTFYVIIDQLYSALVHRINAYTTVRDNFKLLSDISMDMQIEDIEGGMKKLLERYPKDFPDDFTNEFKQFLSFRQRLYH